MVKVYYFDWLDHVNRVLAIIMSKKNIVHMPTYRSQLRTLPLYLWSKFLMTSLARFVYYFSLAWQMKGGETNLSDLCSIVQAINIAFRFSNTYALLSHPAVLFTNCQLVRIESQVLFLKCLQIFANLRNPRHDATLLLDITTKK